MFENCTPLLLRGKAADMGIVVESIADTNESLIARTGPTASASDGARYVGAARIMPKPLWASFSSALLVHCSHDSSPERDNIRTEHCAE